MTNSIVDGIAKALYDEFGVDYKIYSEEVPQGLTYPCFLITIVSPIREHYRDLMYKNSIKVCVQYISDEKTETLSNVYSIKDRLDNCLEYIEILTGQVKGSKQESEIEDKVLSYFVNYDFLTIKEETPKDLMGNMSQNTTVRG